MRFQNVYIESLGWVLPQTIVTSAQLEESFADTLRRLGLPKGQIEKLSGVRERRYWEAGTQPSTVAAMAGEQALQKAGIHKDRVDLVINTSVSRDYLEPATAALVMGRIGFPSHTMGFDIANACLGFVNGMWMAANMIESGQAEIALVVDGENSREAAAATVERLRQPSATADQFRENFATLTLGSGAAAAVLVSKRLATKGHQLKGAVYRSMSSQSHLCLGNYTEMRSDPHGLLVHGCQLAVDTWPVAAAEFGWRSEADVDEIVAHQVSLAHFQTVMGKLGLPLEKALLTFPYLGNVGPASIPLTLALGEAQGRITPGKELCLFGVGSGLGCLMMAVRW
jgi:3-oxoacyl-[acyl-carrier-protein] synthase-3